MKKPEFYLRVCVGLMLTALVLSIPGSVYAMSVPQVGTFGYDVYDIMVNLISQGAIGFGVCVAGVVTGGYLAWKQQFGAMLGVFIGTGIIVKADELVITFGYMI